MKKIEIETKVSDLSDLDLQGENCNLSEVILNNNTNTSCKIYSDTPHGNTVCDQKIETGTKPTPNQSEFCNYSNFKSKSKHFSKDLSKAYKASHPRVWCIFCENNYHWSHSCQMFRSKEEYWHKILTERRCKM